MQIGFDIRAPELIATPEQYINAFLLGEQLGFDYTTISDHLVSPLQVTTKYPYSASGKLTAITGGARHEQLTAIAFLAAKTSRLRFVTAIMVAPYRPAVLTAKIISTIDILSGGRITVGVGTGWMKDEFEAVGAPDFSKRGRVTNEYLAAMQTLWTQETAAFEGEYVSFPELHFEPKPTQKPYPPIWVGGLSDAAMRRAARFGDAWYPVPSDQALPLDTLSRMRDGMARLREFTEAAGRDPASVAVSLRVHEYGEGLAPQANNGERQLFSGSWADIIADLEQLRELGLGAIDFRFTADTTAQAMRDMEAFQRNVLEKFQ